MHLSQLPLPLAGSNAARDDGLRPLMPCGTATLLSMGIRGALSIAPEHLQECQLFVSEHIMVVAVCCIVHALNSQDRSEDEPVVLVVSSRAACMR